MLKFKTEKEYNDFYSMALDPRIRVLCLAAAAWLELEHGRDFVLTSLIRSNAEEKRLGGSGVHAVGRAADGRLKDLPQEAVTSLTTFLDRYFYRGDASRGYPLYYVHGEGDNRHIHIQVGWQHRSSWKGLKV